ncbi:MAG: adenosylcobinamide-GDP ribazoletransferase [Lachnospiraceae bacterium]|nr:adenosylcobinamide-GDP ribazoletransferase [Lachnospiraceae bacterium]
MKIIRWFAAAFSMYSRIPMPHFELDGKDFERAILFLPAVGAVIGTCVYFGDVFLCRFNAPVFVRTSAAVLIPVLVTGGFHLDGFLDTVDSLRSYRSREEKLAILKDPHIGSFALIEAGAALLLMMSGFCIILSSDAHDKGLAAAAAIFVISRALTGITSLFMKKASDEDMLVSETLKADRASLVVLVLWLVLSLVFTSFISILYTLAIAAAFGIFTAVYVHRMNKELGGVVGDTAGYFVTAGQITAVCTLALIMLVSGS